MEEIRQQEIRNLEMQREEEIKKKREEIQRRMLEKQERIRKERERLKAEKNGLLAIEYGGNDESRNSASRAVKSMS